MLSPYGFVGLVPRRIPIPTAYHEGMRRLWTSSRKYIP